MKKLNKILKKMTIYIITSIGGLILLGILFVACAPQFGGKISKTKKEEYAQSNNFKDGKFELKIAPIKITDLGKMFKKMAKKHPEARPHKPITSLTVDSLSLENFSAGSTRLIWFGHSAFLLQMQGLNILIDPMFGDYTAPIKLKSAKRFDYDLPIEPEQLPFIDIVIFSHDHYDHLDYNTVLKLKDKVGKFYVPLGLSAHLISWGVNESKITEHDWWESTQYNGINFVCLPAKHFSGRGLLDRAATLWASWCIIGAKDKIYFSGDSGYADHFKEIGEKYGPFDLALIECGQYDSLWSDVHMFPEESVQAGIDLKSEQMIPIHWGSFTLANHGWKESVNRAIAESKRLDRNISTPKIGEFILLNEAHNGINKWWEE